MNIEEKVMIEVNKWLKRYIWLVWLDGALVGVTMGVGVWFLANIWIGWPLGVSLVLAIMFGGWQAYAAMRNRLIYQELKTEKEMVQ